MEAAASPSSVESLGLKDLEDAITTVAAELHAGEYRLLMLIGEFDRRRGWFVHGVHSCAHWLAWRCGIGINAAREKVRVARRLEGLPQMADGLRKGELSYSKARALTRIAHPGNEAWLVKLGLTGTANHVAKVVRYARRYGEAEAVERANRHDAERTVTWYWDRHGCLVLKGRLPPEAGALVIKALDAAMDAAREVQRSAADVTAVTSNDAPGHALAADHRAAAAAPTPAAPRSAADVTAITSGGVGTDAAEMAPDAEMDAERHPTPPTADVTAVASPDAPGQALAADHRGTDAAEMAPDAEMDAERHPTPPAVGVTAVASPDAPGQALAADHRAAAAAPGPDIDAHMDAARNALPSAADATAVTFEGGGAGAAELASDTDTNAAQRAPSSPGDITAVTSEGDRPDTAAFTSDAAMRAAWSAPASAADVTAVTSGAYARAPGLQQSPGDATAVVAGEDADHQPIEARRADALVDLAETFLANGRREGAAGERYQVHILVASEALGRREPAAANDALTPTQVKRRITPAQLEDGPSIPIETARRVCCDASVVSVVESDDGNVLDVGRRTRTIPPAIRRGLKRRDGGCRFPGCTNRRFVDAHHVQHWADGGATSMDNLVLLCGYHHRLVHEGGFSVAREADGEVAFRRPDGDVIETAPTLDVLPDGLQRLRAANRDAGVHVGPRTCRARWGGEQIDYNIALDNLAGMRAAQR